jgi:hypothetical protein
MPVMIKMPFFSKGTGSRKKKIDALIEFKQTKK